MDRIETEKAAATRVFTAADTIAGRIVGSRSSSQRTIESAGQKVIRGLETERIKASLDLLFAQRVAASDYSVQTCESFNKAQEAMAGLNLSGINEVIIRPSTNTHVQDRRMIFEVMIPHNVATEGRSALEAVQITELIRSDVIHGRRILEALSNKGIQAAICPHERIDEGRDYIVFVKQAEAQNARAVINDSSANNGERF